MKKIKIAIIGGGKSSAVGRAHLSALSIDRDWEIVSIIPSAFDVVNNFPESLNHDVVLLENLDDLLKRSKKEKIDFILDLTPSNLHYENAFKILNHGINLISEKPLTLNLKNAINLFEIANSKKIKLYTIQNYSTFVMVMLLKKLIQDSAIGSIIHFQGRILQQGFISKFNGQHPTIQKWRLVDSEIPMVMHDLGSHLFHMVGYLIGQYPNEVIANFNKSNVYSNLISSCEILGRFNDKISYNLTFGKSFLGKLNDFQIEVFGTLGSLKWELTNSEELELANEEGVKSILNRQWAEYRYPELLKFSRFKPGHFAGFVESLANYYITLKEDYINSRKMNNHLASPEKVMDYIKLMEACCVSSKSKQWTKVN